jgi:hypothetical protein
MDITLDDLLVVLILGIVMGFCLAAIYFDPVARWGHYRRLEERRARRR